MKRSLHTNRDRKLAFRLTAAEYQKIERGFQGSTSQQISGYVRAILLDKPITVYTRNQSLDELMGTLQTLQKELAAIGKNFNQVVRKLNAVNAGPDIVFFARQCTVEQQQFLQKIDQIQQLLHQYADQWLHG